MITCIRLQFKILYNKIIRLLSLDKLMFLEAQTQPNSILKMNHFYVASEAKPFPLKQILKLNLLFIGMKSIIIKINII